MISWILRNNPSSRHTDVFLTKLYPRFQYQPAGAVFAVEVEFFFLQDAEGFLGENAAEQPSRYHPHISYVTRCTISFQQWFHGALANLLCPPRA